MTTLISVSELNLSSKDKFKDICHTNKFYNNQQLSFLREEKTLSFGTVKVMKSKTESVGLTSS